MENFNEFFERFITLHGIFTSDTSPAFLHCIRWDLNIENLNRLRAFFCVLKISFTQKQLRQFTVRLLVSIKVFPFFRPHSKAFMCLSFLQAFKRCQEVWVHQRLSNRTFHHSMHSESCKRLLFNQKSNGFYFHGNQKNHTFSISIPLCIAFPTQLNLGLRKFE